MKYLKAVKLKLINRSPLSVDDINNHKDADQIWATIAEIEKEAQDACQKSWDDGHWAGKTNK